MSLMGSMSGVGGVLVLTAVVVSALAVGVAAVQAPVTPVPSVDLDRYVGQWYEIARFDNRFQKTCAGGVTATYARRADGRLDVINACRKAGGATTSARGVARPAAAGVTSRLEVRFAPAFLSFLPMVWGDYWIIGLGSDYDWAVVGSPDRKYLWVLSRTPDLDAASYEMALDCARANGFDVGKLIRTPQP